MKTPVLICILLLVSGGLFGQPCANPFFVEDFSSANGWTSTGAGNVNISNGTCNFNNAVDGNYDRMYKFLPQTLPDSCFRAVFKFTVSQNSPGQGAGANLLGLSADTLDPLSYDNSQSYATTNQDGFVLVLTSNATDNNINNWWIQLETKKGTTRVTAPNVIHLNAATLTYYVVFERLTASVTTLKLFSDPFFNVLLDQATNTVNPLITGLRTVHIGVTTWGYWSRHVNGTVDDIRICADCDDPAPPPAFEPEVFAPNVFSPNGDGVNDQLVFTNLEYYPEAKLAVYNRWGQQVFEEKKYDNDWAGQSGNKNLAEGVYYYVLTLTSEKSLSGFVELVR